HCRSVKRDSLFGFQNQILRLLHFCLFRLKYATNSRFVLLCVRESIKKRGNFHSSKQVILSFGWLSASLNLQFRQNLKYFLVLYISCVILFYSSFNLVEI